MGLLSSLQNAVSGLNVSQASLDIVSRNVANKATPGYHRREVTQQETSATGISAGAARTVSINRMLDSMLQKQVRTETSGARYAATRADYLSRLDGLYGQPGSGVGLNESFSKLNASLGLLAADPASASTRNDVLAKAQSLTSTLNGLSADIQQMRGELEARIANDVASVNGLLEGLQRTTQQLRSTKDDATRAGLLDQRDKYVDELAGYMDIQTSGSDGDFSVYTNSGVQLFGAGRGLKIGFDERYSVSADSLYNSDPTKSGVGDLFVLDAAGGRVSLTGTGLLRSGSLAAMLDLRDKTLVEAQGQLDEFAAALATSLGDKTVSGTAATAGAATGFDLDLAALQNGNVISLDYTNVSTGVKSRVSFIKVSDPTALPLPAGATADPTDTEFGIDFSGGIGAAITAIGTALGAGFTVSNPSASTLRILDDGAGNTRNVDALFARATNTALTGQGTEIPFFVDGTAGNTVYTGSFEGGVPQKRGFAGGIKVNPNLITDPSRLVVMQTTPTTTGSGDTTRPNFLRDQLKSAIVDFSPSTSLTGAKVRYATTAGQYLDRVIATQTQAASTAKTLSEGQDVVVASLQERVSDQSGVNIDKELSDLIELQNIYSANARMVSAVKDMFDILMRI
jgi:flagellar hook-associated protein 1